MRLKITNCFLIAHGSSYLLVDTGYEHEWDRFTWELAKHCVRVQNISHLSVPFPIWHSLAWIAEMLPRSALSRNQVELMEVDTVASAGLPGFDAL